LSKRMTRNPREAIRSQNASSHTPSGYQGPWSAASAQRGLCKYLVTNVNAVGTGDTRRLVGCHVGASLLVAPTPCHASRARLFLLCARKRRTLQVRRADPRATFPPSPTRRRAEPHWRARSNSCTMPRKTKWSFRREPRRRSARAPTGSASLGARSSRSRNIAAASIRPSDSPKRELASTRHRPGWRGVLYDWPGWTSWWRSLSKCPSTFLQEALAWFSKSITAVPDLSA